MDSSTFHARGRVTPGTKLNLAIGSLILLAILCDATFKNTLNRQIVYSLLLIAFFGFLLAVNEMGYGVWVDDAGVTVRRQGFLWLIGLGAKRRLSYRDITNVVSETAATAKKPNLFPFFKIYGEVQGAEECLTILSEGLDPFDAREILRRIRAARPETVPDAISRFIDQLP